MKIAKIDNNYGVIEMVPCCEKFASNLRDEVIYGYIDTLHGGFYFRAVHPTIYAVKLTYCPFCGKELGKQWQMK